MLPMLKIASYPKQSSFKKCVEHAVHQEFEAQDLGDIRFKYGLAYGVAGDLGLAMLIDTLFNKKSKKS